MIGSKLVAAALLAASAGASAATLTLQQGANGYNGCSDTYITRHYASTAQKFNAAATLTVATANYNWLGSGW